uniref:2OG-Fe(II) oxygenase superfamily protein n=1 Tax=Pithovirus LCPAC101 TaxID=2506586 RepID=A0A481Z2L0_9VIRU|nr:MAG: 2OG-Fe(II) oxygenase superfamily protein [Pithovirus LCPAC101]
MSAICLTAGERAENHVGMEMIGSKDISEHGFTIDDLDYFLEKFKKINKNVRYDLVRLDSILTLSDEEKELFPEFDKDKVEPAALLIIRNGVDILLGKEGGHIELFDSLNKLKWDKQYYDRRRKRVLNKHARHNLVFGDDSQDPDYENLKGRIYSYNDLPLLKKWHSGLTEVLGTKAENMAVEGNNYYDVKKTGIGFHGDGERKKVIAGSLGEWRELHYSWYYKYKPIGRKMEFKLYGGDMYIMSEKTSGFDWKRKNIPTLRHAAGRMDGSSKKYLTIKKK